MMLNALNDNLLEDCIISPPPTKVSKKTLALGYNQQTLNLKKCNQDKALLREWKNNQMKILGAKSDGRQ